MIMQRCTKTQTEDEKFGSETKKTANIFVKNDRMVESDVLITRQRMMTAIIIWLPLNPLPHPHPSHTQNPKPLHNAMLMTSYIT